jgi:hypothetical protein
MYQAGKGGKIQKIGPTSESFVNWDLAIFGGEHKTVVTNGVMESHRNRHFLHFYKEENMDTGEQSNFFKLSFGAKAYFGVEAELTIK